MQLMLSHPFLAAAVARLPIVDATDLSWCGTAATDGYTVYVDSDFMASLSDDEGKFVLAHEYLHVVLGHADRRRDRAREVWNQAADFATNQTLVEFGFEMPEKGLYEPSFRGETAEAIYEALLGKEASSAVAGGSGSGETGASRGRRKGLGGAGARLRKSLSEEQLRRLVAGGGWDIQLDATDAEGAANRGSESLTGLERRRMREGLAASMRSTAHGRAAGFISDEIEAASASYVSWEALLAQFIGGVRRSDYRTYPFNKKHIHRGLYLPTLGAPGPEYLVVAMDTSGSVYQELASAFLAEIDSIRGVGECRLTLLQCDAAIEHVTVFEPWDEALVDADGGRTRIYGRGGTSFIPPFEWIEKQIEEGEAAPDALIYLTDGYGPFPTEEPMFPVLWVLSEDGTSEEQVPFGAVIRMPRLSD